MSCVLAHPLLQGRLEALIGQHQREVTSTQEAAAKQLTAQSRTADSLVKELEAALSGVQLQLTQQVERADVASSQRVRGLAHCLWIVAWRGGGLGVVKFGSLIQPKHESLPHC